MDLHHTTSVNTDEPLDDDLRARRARVFREVRAEERRRNAAVRREFELARASATPKSRRILPGIVWATGVAAATKFAPVLSRWIDVPTPLVFACLGFMVGFGHGASLDATSIRSRIRHAIVVAAIYAAFLGGVVSLWPPSTW